MTFNKIALKKESEGMWKHVGMRYVFVPVILFYCLYGNNVLAGCSDFRMIDHGDSVEVVCADGAVSQSSYKPGIVTLKKDTYMDHDSHSTFACAECHNSGQGGRISGFGKDIAHSLCKGCHSSKGGPVSCKDCHGGKYLRQYSTPPTPVSVQTPAPVNDTTHYQYATQQNRDEQAYIQSQNDLSAEQLRSKKIKKKSERFDNKLDAVNIPKITERTYTYKNGIKIGTTKDKIK